MNDTIKLRISKEDKTILKKEAKKYRLTVSAYIRFKMLNSKPVYSLKI